MDITNYRDKTEWPDTTPADTEWKGSLVDLFGDLIGAFADVVLPEMVETELDEQRELVESGDYCSALLRQAAFVEFLLQWAMIAEIESYRDRELSNKEQKAIKRMGNKPMVYMANAFGLLTDSEYHAYTELMDKRNTVAHNWWMAFSDEDREDFEDVTGLVLEALESAFEDTDFP
jgi:succinate dehydrogenase flavin-adding protein (antitoxin of CptAB toxin-antitoxin module)